MKNVCMDIIVMWCTIHKWETQYQSKAKNTKKKNAIPIVRSRMGRIKILQ